VPINVLSEADFRPRGFAEARRAFDAKVPITEEEFERLSVRNKAQAFKVAQVNNARLLQRIRDIAGRAIEEGTEWRLVRQRLNAEFAAAGIPPAPLNRLRFMFEDSTRRAYSEARVEMLDEHADAFPYRQYLTVGNGVAGVSNVRAEHAALHRKVFRWDDLAMQPGAFLPPWDYGCRCGVIPLTAGMVRRGRMTVWTYSGGAIRPTDGPQAKRAKPIKLEPNPNYDRSAKRFDLSELDADLRKIVEERTK